MIKSVLLLSCLATFTLAQVPSSGVCPSVPTTFKLNRTRFAGKWFESERYFDIFQLTGRCNSFVFTNNDTYFGVEYSEIGVAHGLRTAGTFELTPVSSSPSKFTHTFQIFDFPLDMPFWILGTDYENYAVAFSCIDLLVVNLKFLWILNKKRFAGTFGPAYEILDQANLDRSILMSSDQILCPIIS